MCDVQLILQKICASCLLHAFTQAASPPEAWFRLLWGIFVSLWFNPRKWWTFIYACAGALSVNYHMIVSQCFYMRCHTIETNKMPGLLSPLDPCSLFSIIFLGPKVFWVFFSLLFSLMFILSFWFCWHLWVYINAMISMRWLWYSLIDKIKNCGKKVAGKAPKDSTVLNQPVTIVAGCVNAVRSYCSREVQVRLHYRLHCRGSVLVSHWRINPQQMSEWEWPWDLPNLTILPLC